MPSLFMGWLLHFVSGDWEGLNWRSDKYKDWGTETNHYKTTWFKTDEEVFELVEAHKKELIEKSKKEKIQITNL